MAGPAARAGRPDQQRGFSDEIPTRQEFRLAIVYASPRELRVAGTITGTITLSAHLKWNIRQETLVQLPGRAFNNQRPGTGWGTSERGLRPHQKQDISSPQGLRHDGSLCRRPRK